MYKQRIHSLRQMLQSKGLQAGIITSYENYFYFSGFTGSNAVLVISGEKNFLFTDMRYKIQVSEEVMDYEIIIVKQNFYHNVCTFIEKLSYKAFGFEGEKMVAQQFISFQEIVQPDIIISISQPLSVLRSIKDTHEIELIRNGCKISDEVFVQLLNAITVGMTEMDILIELEKIKLEYGNEKPSFGTIVAAGNRSALPHAKATDNKVLQNDLVLVDYGMSLNGYMTDMTRSIWINQPSSQLQEIFHIVYESFEKVMRNVKPGMTGNELDDIVRQLFFETGYEQYSLKGLGHGVGLEIHEFPRVTLGSEDVIEKNMIITIEPGLYLPEVGGVRIEDTVLVTLEGCETLMNSPLIPKLNF